jgi:hypothetical protein
MDQINENLDAQVQVDEVSVKVFHKFPSVSLVLSDITLWSSHHFRVQDFSYSGADTLLTAERLYVSFNLMGMIRKKYVVREVDIRNGFLQLLTDSRGEINYKLLKQRSEREGQYRLIDISQLRISGFQIRLDNRTKQLIAGGQLDNLEFNGKFTRGNTLIRGNLKGTLQEVSNKGVLYASDRSLGARIQMQVQDSLLIFESGQLQLARISTHVGGKVILHAGKGMDLDLAVDSRNLEIHQVLDLLPKELAMPLLDIKGNGTLQVSSRITGMLSSTQTPSIEAGFETSKANLSWEKLPFTLKSLNLTGSYSNGGEFNPLTTQLSIDKVSAVIGKDQVNGSGWIRNFVDPDFKFSLKGTLHPDQWLDWYEAIPLHEVDGTVVSDIRVSGSFDRGKEKGKRIQALDIAGGIRLEEVMARLQPGQVAFEQVNGSVQIDNDFWKPSFSGHFGKSDFSISGSGLNLISFLIRDDVNLVASADFRSDHLDLQEVLDQLPRDPSGKRASVLFPDMLDLKLAFSINDFEKDKLKARHVRGVAIYDSPFLFVDSLTMQSMDGTLLGSFGMTQNRERHIFTTVNARMNNLDISKLFESFNNFGQRQLTHEHLKGTITGSSAFSATFDSSFHILPATILCENEVSIHDGELNSFSPILALSRFVDVKELENIRFKALNNTVLVKDSEVIIPVMDIQSNALNLQASGTHRFDNTYDYRLQLKLSELLYNKARQGKRSREFEVARDESDTRILFLKIYDDGSGSNVEMDKEQAAEKIRNDLKEEKTELRKILNEELGLFSRDQTLEQEGPDEEEGGESFRFRFEEEEDSTSVNDSRKKQRRDKKKAVKKDSSQTKPATKYVIDE